ncbi:MAG TPA: A/G-specific adenine glycosylase [Phycisphaerales bacterium]|nr:A/G-specific adenine glycosylase [Phycisphaerales bacterium]
MAGMTDSDLIRALLDWFAAEGRDLPWRDAPAGERDPYRVLVSELMLQQTQTARVVERFGAFIARFPTVATLADADEAEVLAAWSGLGYYRRARLLHAVARRVVEHHAGEIPRDPAALLGLPGVGRYTAGAVASIAFGLPEPIVDGNVARVLLRVGGRDGPPTDPSTTRWVWARARELVETSTRPGVFNESLMELGATVCTPRCPRCGVCPIARFCEARRLGRQDEIPPPKPRTKQQPLYIAAVLAIDPKGRRLVERRPDNGLWAGLWQPPSIERPDRFSTRDEIADTLGLNIETEQPIDRFSHQTTHRDVRFEVWNARRGRAGNGRCWRSKRQIESLALGTPQRRILIDTADRS